MTTEKRLKEIKIRVTEREYQSLLARKTKTRLAEWLRELALDQAPKTQSRTVNPAILYELNRIGVNLNQITRLCHNQKPNIDLVSIATSLKNIEKNLNMIREKIT